MLAAPDALPFGPLGHPGVSLPALSKWVHSGKESSELSRILQGEPEIEPRHSDGGPLEDPASLARIFRLLLKEVCYELVVLIFTQLQFINMDRTDISA